VNNTCTAAVMESNLIVQKQQNIPVFSKLVESVENVQKTVGQYSRAFSYTYCTWTNN
jgi:hypothetical protein